MIKLRKLKISYERGRQTLLFLFCLFLAFIIWSVHKLSGDYSIYLNYRVQVTTDIQGRASVAFSDNLLTLRGRGSGFHILQQRFLKEGEVVRLEIDKKLFKRVPSTKDGFVLLSSDIRDELSENFGDKFIIEYFTVDSLFFNFPKQVNLRVPVAPIYEVEYKEQYMAVKKMKLNPDTITIYGDYAVIQLVDSIKTKKIAFNNLSKTKNGIVDLEQLPGIRFSQNDVYYTLEVERYVEKSISLPVEVRDCPSEKKVTFFPQEVKLIYRMPFKYIKNTDQTENLKIVIDYKDIINSVNYFVDPSLERVPDNFLSFDFDPKIIECKVVENKIK